MAALTTLLDSEASLVQEAALALPHSFDKCTHSMGPLKQAVHLCLTCAVPRGLCSACSVACHGDHEQIELFPKRAFVCDCPARVGDTVCTLQRDIVVDNSGNTYGPNFEGKFCRCGRTYDAKRERETMVQCLVCEDWYHESCLNLRTRPTEQPSSTDPPAVLADGVTDADSEASNDLPSPLLPSSAYETLICGACVLSNDTLQRWAGTNGIMMVVRSGGTDIAPQAQDGGIDFRWRILDGSEDEPKVDLDVVPELGEGKRPIGKESLGIDGEGRPPKKLRVDDGLDIPVIESVATTVPMLAASPPCLAPPSNPLAQHILNGIRRNTQKESNTELADELGHGDIFLTEGWRNRWCRCPKCLSALEPHAYLLQEEETYEPPEDPDSAKSLEELGMRALQNMPRDRAIDGILAYNAMRDELMTYFRPFAQEGRVVREEDVREFFDRKAQQGESIR